MPFLLYSLIHPPTFITHLHNMREICPPPHITLLPYDVHHQMHIERCILVVGKLKLDCRFDSKKELGLKCRNASLVSRHHLGVGEAHIVRDHRDNGKCGST
jgi:hypothetical protein